MTQTWESLSFFQFVCACFHATMTTTTYQRTMQDLNIRRQQYNVKATNPNVSGKLKLLQQKKQKKTGR